MASASEKTSTLHAAKQSDVFLKKNNSKTSRATSGAVDGLARQVAGKDYANVKQNWKSS